LLHYFCDEPYDYQGLKEIALVSTLHPVDFNRDGNVDGVDFAAWHLNFPTSGGASLAQGDADGDGDVDGADFIAWQTNYPSTSGSGAAPVPEPRAWLLALLAAFAPLAWHRRFVPIRKA